MENKVNKEVATKDFYRWIDKLGYCEADFAEGEILNGQISSRDKIVRCIEKGTIEVLESGEIKQVIEKPITAESGSVQLASLTYKSDYQAWEQNDALKGIDLQKETSKISLAYAKMLTGTGTAMLGKLHAADYKVLQSIVSFFFV